MFRIMIVAATFTLSTATLSVADIVAIKEKTEAIKIIESGKLIGSWVEKETRSEKSTAIQVLYQGSVFYCEISTEMVILPNKLDGDYTAICFEVSADEE